MLSLLVDCRELLFQKPFVTIVFVAFLPVVELISSGFFIRFVVDLFVWAFVYLELEGGMGKHPLPRSQTPKVYWSSPDKQ
jgi:hypothetical protein